MTGARSEIDRASGSGPTVVYLHHWGGSAHTWDAVVARLPDTPAVRWDQRGWGRSRRLPGPFGLDALADDALDVVDRDVRGDWVLVGHSMGGKVAQIVASRRPPGLRSLVLLAPGPPRPPASVTPAYRQQLEHAYDSDESVSQALASVLTFRRPDDASFRQLVGDARAGAPGAVREWPRRGIVADVSDGASRIDVPVHVVVGEHDRVEPPGVLRDHLLPVIPGATIQVVEGAGHLLPVEAPGAVAHAVRTTAG